MTPFFDFAAAVTIAAFRYVTAAARRTYADDGIPDTLFVRSASVQMRRARYVSEQAS